MKIEAILADITKLKVDAVVNAANPSLLGGGGVHGAIHRAAGPELLKACIQLNGCAAGDAKSTPGFNLPARFIIHTVGPVWRGGGEHEAETLASCYRRSLEVAEALGINSIAFPAISTGAYGYPLEKAARVAIENIKEYAQNTSSIDQVFLCCFSEKALEIYQKLIGTVSSTPL
jgi:O-acetyl-ADP-ribose deacetylase (regulator of RNase III)